MKKLLAVFVLLIYFCATTGFVISMHYCMDRLDSAEIGNTQNNRCPKCGMHKDGGCCRDDVRMVKLQTFHVKASSADPVLPSPAAQTVPTNFLLAPFENVPSSSLPVFHGPPPDGQETYIQNRVFRI